MQCPFGCVRTNIIKTKKFMNIDFIGNVNAFTGGWWVFLWFILFTISIAILSLTMVKTVEMMAARTKRIPVIFYTAILLAFATSVPELMTGIDSSLLVHPQPIFAYFDNSGSNFMNIFTAAIFCLIFSFYFDNKIMMAIKKKKIVQIKIVNGRKVRYYNNVISQTFNVKNKDNVMITWILVILNLLVMLSSYILPFGNAIIPGLEISAVCIIPIGTWTIFLMYVLFRKGSHDKPQANTRSIFYKMPKFFLFVSFFVIVGALLVVSIIDADLVQAFSDMYHIDDVVSGGIIMAVATGLPEFVSNFYLFKRQHFNMIFESIVGSLWMNTLLMFFIDVCFRQDALFHYANQMVQLHDELASYGGLAHAPMDVVQNLTHKLVPWENYPVQGAMKNAIMMGPWNVLSFILVSFIPVLSTRTVGNHKWLGRSVVALQAITFIVGFCVIAGMFWNF